MADEILFLTELLGLKVFDLKGRTLGVVKDAAIVPLVDPVRVDRFLIGSGAAWLTVRHDQVRSISLDGIHLRDENPDAVPLRRIHAAGGARPCSTSRSSTRRAARWCASTTSPSRSGRRTAATVLWVLEVDIGIRSIFRRLVQGVLPPRWIRRLQVRHSAAFHPLGVLQHSGARSAAAPAPEHFQPAAGRHAPGRPGRHRRGAERRRIAKRSSKTSTAKWRPTRCRKSIPDIQASILESLETEKAAEIVEEMAPDEAADVLAELEEETSDEILEEMEHEPKTGGPELLEFDEDSAGGMMNTEYVALPETATVADAIQALQEQRRAAGNPEHAVPGGSRGAA